MLFAGEIAVRRPQPLGLIIYVDVSGSMYDLLPHLRRALHSLRHEVKPSLYWFSTQVVAAKKGDLESGRVKSTGGTEVASVLRHAVQSLPEGAPALVLTDGYLESVHSTAIAQLMKRRNAIVIGVDQKHGRAVLRDRRAVDQIAALAVIDIPRVDEQREVLPGPERDRFAVRPVEGRDAEDAEGGGESIHWRILEGQAHNNARPSTNRQHVASQLITPPVGGADASNQLSRNATVGKFLPPNCRNIGPLLRTPPPTDTVGAGV